MSRRRYAITDVNLAPIRGNPDMPRLAVEYLWLLIITCILHRVSLKQSQGKNKQGLQGLVLPYMVVCTKQDRG